MVGWNDDTVVIAFRGTASLANVRADLQVCVGGGMSGRVGEWAGGRVGD